jgi:hypothetical protein
MPFTCASNACSGVGAGAGGSKERPNGRATDGSAADDAAAPATAAEGAGAHGGRTAGTCAREYADNASYAGGGLVGHWTHSTDNIVLQTQRKRGVKRE